MSDTILILGASARAAADSVRRAGHVPRCVDLFADSDLAQWCHCERVAEYPVGLKEKACELPPTEWLYTGGIENYPDTVEHVSARHTLCGNSADVLRRVRDPGQLARALADGRVPMPITKLNADHLGKQHRWLRKPKYSSGGMGIDWHDSTKMDRKPSLNKNYFQQYIDGKPYAAVFVAAGGKSLLLGVTKQILGNEWTGAGPFQYAGSVGPIAMSVSQTATLARMGDCLAGTFALEGLFGVDFIGDGEKLWPLEVNPRYTASVEILERALGTSAISLHLAACLDGKLPEVVPDEHKGICHGKAILFARSSIEISADWSQRALDRASREWPQLADIPHGGTLIQPGEPVVTLFASGVDIDQVWEKLQQRLDITRAALGDV